MSTDETLALASEFPSVDEAAWRAAVDRALSRDASTLSPEQKEAIFARKLVTKTYDGIDIRPLYTRANTSIDPLGLPGLPPFRRGATPDGSTQDGWDVRARVRVEDDFGATSKRALGELENGASSLLLETGTIRATTSTLERVLEGVYLDLVPIVLEGPNTGRWANALGTLWGRRGIAPDVAQGCFGYDPIGALATSGRATSLERELEGCVSLAVDTSSRYDSVATIVVDATRYHEAGSSNVEELGCALATGIEYLRLLQDAGLPADDALLQIEFRLAATAEQFTTIAKLRAARILWARVAQVAGATGGRRRRFGLPIHAQSSRAMLTRYDPWVNLLRATVACFAAGVGGATAVTIDPFDAESRGEASALGARMARNTQSLLIDEAHVARVIDPAGGSWYVETLTDQIAAASWAWMQEIERAGGIIAALKAGSIQKRIASTCKDRMRSIARRRDAITGVSEFPNVAEEIPRLERRTVQPRGRLALPVVRYAEPFETLRARADDAARTTGQRPSVFLATLGSLAEHTPRATFVKNLFEAAGIVAISSGTVDATNVVEQFVASRAPLACICGADERYASEAEAVARALRSAAPRRLYLAGAVEPLQDALRVAGIDEFVIMGCDAIDLLERAQAAAGVSDDG